MQEKKKDEKFSWRVELKNSRNIQFLNPTLFYSPSVASTFRLLTSEPIIFADYKCLIILTNKAKEFRSTVD